MPEEAGSVQRLRLFASSETEFFAKDSGLPVVFNPNGQEGVVNVGDLRARLME